LLELSGEEGQLVTTSPRAMELPFALASTR
jgi:hypothetical protein